MRSFFYILLYSSFLLTNIYWELPLCCTLIWDLNMYMNSRSQIITRKDCLLNIELKQKELPAKFLFYFFFKNQDEENGIKTSSSLNIFLEKLINSFWLIFLFHRFNDDLCLMVSHLHSDLIKNFVILLLKINNLG